MGKKKIGLYFGSFNPIHIGHVIIANHFVENSDLDEIWFVVTPHNPFKKKETLLDNHHRLELVTLACEGFDKLKPSDVEFKLPQPNYTINTLVVLSEKYTDYEFCLIMGADNLNSFHKWKNYEAILEHYPIFVYPRIDDSTERNELLDHPQIHMVDAPIIQISSTQIRRAIADGKNVTPLLPASVWKYIDQMNLYRNLL